MSADSKTPNSEPGIEGDWTQGKAALTFERCLECMHIRYFSRGFCPECGSKAYARNTSKGLGQVYAMTVVHRASVAEFRSIVPYLIALVDMDEGFRIMAHAQPELVVGARVCCTFREVAGRLLPYLEAEKS